MPPRKSNMTSRKSVALTKAKTASKNTAHERKNDTDVRFLWECVQDMKGPGTIHGKLDLGAVAARMSMKKSAIVSRFKRITRDMRAKEAADAKARENDDAAEDEAENAVKMEEDREEEDTTEEECMIERLIKEESIEDEVEKNEEEI
ncbi:uncharacterized protein N7498_008415 [Penicillium cinerascens]|uniref:Uncharacterized protein n=1 Tax=Penicillium cinerascens TaxID=70096 RepID=A0A9W9MC88_9EURO|nr:uncharacterized protein N7498_008415 [Penicillium cinerascens]KAJ5194977.1 hypothetical protein N7498_008415 [Penicillium cinerascens]